MILEILKLLTLAILLILCSVWTKVIGGFLYAVLSFSFRMPYLGKLLKVFFYDFVKIIIIVKLVSWLVSASGVLLGWLAFSLMWKTGQDIYEYWIIFAVSLGSVINITYNIFEFQIVTYSEIVKNAQPYYHKFLKPPEFDILFSDKLNQKSFSRSLFIDLHLPQLFRLLLSIGMVYFGMGNLGFMSETHSSTVSLSESVKTSFSTIPLLTTADPIFKGTMWIFCSTICSFLIFLWTLFFISSAQSMFSDEGEIEVK